MRKIQRLNKLYMTFLIFLISFTTYSCIKSFSPLGDKLAMDLLKRDIQIHNFSTFVPPRSGNCIGSIISFTKNDFDILVASADTCYPKIKRLNPVDVAWLNNSYVFNSNSGVVLSIIEKLKEKVDVDILLNSKHNINVSIKLGKPHLFQCEKIVIEDAIRKLDRNSSCYKEATKPGNIIIISTLAVKSIIYEFKTNSGKNIQLTSDLLKSMKLSPYLQNQYVGKSSIIIEGDFLLGYRAIEVRELPGLTHDNLEFNELTYKQIEEYRYFYQNAD